MELRRFESLDSTNKHCELLDLNTVGEFTVVWALAQTAGVGQRGNRWVSAPGMNLTFSVVLKPAFLSANRQFGLTQAASLAVVDLLDGLPTGERAAVKWPNDIYVGDRKVCGMLISNHLHDGVVGSSVCGIGLNVNQTSFGGDLPCAVSLAMLTGMRFELEPLLSDLCERLRLRYEGLRRGEDFGDEYLRRLLRRGEPWRYADATGEFTAVIDGVDEYGRLLLTRADGERLRRSMKEIAMLPRRG